MVVAARLRALDIVPRRRPSSVAPLGVIASVARADERSVRSARRASVPRGGEVIELGGHTLVRTNCVPRGVPAITGSRRTPG